MLSAGVLAVPRSSGSGPPRDASMLAHAGSTSSEAAAGTESLPVRHWGDSSRGLLVVADFKLLICPFGRAESAALADVAKDLECAARGSTDTPCGFQTQRRPSNVTSDRNLLLAFKDPSWTKAVLYRDPLERFVESYLSCRDAKEGAACSAAFGEPKASFKRAVRIVANATNPSAAVGSNVIDAFQPQHELCMGTLPGIVRDHFNHAAKLTAQNSRRIVGDLLRQVGVTKPENLPSFERHYPPISEKQASRLAQEAEARQYKYYSSKIVVRSVLRAYAADYRLFDMEVPHWAASAAGAEWLREVNLAAQSPKRAIELQRLIHTSNTSWQADWRARCKKNKLHCRCDSPHRQTCSWRPYAQQPQPQPQKQERTPQRTPSSAREDPCADKVSYLFLKGSEGMPDAIERAWLSYFDTCPEGSFTVHIHEQRPAPARQTGLGQLGKRVPDPVTGELRFTWRMQLAALRLYESALSQATRQGCTPAWLHLVSVSTVPLAACDEVHRLMAAQPPLSMIQARACEADECSCDENRPLSMLETATFLKASQWSTLRREDAAFLTAPALREARARDWYDSHTPDEHFVVNELAQAQRPFAWQDVTEVSNMTCSSHPVTYECTDEREASEFRSFTVAAAANGKVFARKVGPRCADVAVAGWTEHASHATSPGLFAAGTS